jgi:hypothetical protein
LFDICVLCVEPISNGGGLGGKEKPKLGTTGAAGTLGLLSGFSCGDRAEIPVKACSCFRLKPEKALEP